MNGIHTGIIIGVSLFLILLTAISVIRARYKKFTNRDFVLRFRNGTLINEGYGGAYFMLPLIDELIVLSTTVQRLEVDTGEVITAENQDVVVKGFVVWRIEEPVKTYQSISGDSEYNVMTEINKTLVRLVESIIRTTVAQLSLDQVLRERSIIIEAIMSELVTVVGPMGIKINTVEIQHVDVVNQDLFDDLQETYRQEARLTAQKAQSLTTQNIRSFKAEQEEKSEIRELEKEQKILLQQQELNKVEQNRLRTIQKLEKERETANAELIKQKLQVEAETKLMEIEFEAKSKKQQKILQEIEVETKRIQQIADANAEATRKNADAEAYKLEVIAKATRKMLIAEADGLREKLQARKEMNDILIMEQLIQQLPEIAKSMKVGDVNWVNIGGKDQNNGSPLGMVPENILQLLSFSKAFGLDIKKIVDKMTSKSNGDDLEELSEEDIESIIISE